jgi:hypothetical protein
MSIYSNNKGRFGHTDLIGEDKFFDGFATDFLLIGLIVLFLFLFSLVGIYINHHYEQEKHLLTIAKPGIIKRNM